ncbi:hypothetical protein [Mycobacterium neglectum]|nr:hypothetical protein [Mycobacterium neglectum]
MFNRTIEAASNSDEFRYSTASFDGENLLGSVAMDVDPSWFFFNLSSLQ